MNVIDVLRELRTVAGRVAMDAEESSEGNIQVSTLDVERLCDLFVYLGDITASGGSETADLLLKTKVVVYNLGELGGIIDQIQTTGGNLKNFKRAALLTLIYTSAVDGVDTREKLETPPSEFRQSGKKASSVG